MIKLRTIYVCDNCGTFKDVILITKTIIPLAKKPFCFALWGLEAIGNEIKKWRYTYKNEQMLYCPRCYNNYLKRLKIYRNKQKKNGIFRNILKLLKLS